MVPDTPSLRWKRLIKSEVEALTANDMNVVCVYETTANRAGQGEAAGIIDGREAKEEAIILGQPKGTAIYFAVDYDAGPADYDKIAAYLKAAQAELKDYKVGVYAGHKVIEEMALRKACTHFWQTYAWSGGKLSKSSNIYQYKNGQTVSGIQVDLNDSFGGEGWWNYNMNNTEDWKEILRNCLSDPEKWIADIESMIEASKAPGNVGTYERLKFFPELITKIANMKGKV
jgi:hypothetical protein